MRGSRVGARITWKAQHSRRIRWCLISISVPRKDVPRIDRQYIYEMLLTLNLSLIIPRLLNVVTPNSFWVRPNLLCPVRALQESVFCSGGIEPREKDVPNIILNNVRILFDISFMRILPINVYFNN